MIVYSHSPISLNGSVVSCGEKSLMTAHSLACYPTSAATSYYLPEGAARNKAPCCQQDGGMVNSSVIIVTTVFAWNTLHLLEQAENSSLCIISSPEI